VGVLVGKANGRIDMTLRRRRNCCAHEYVAHRAVFQVHVAELNELNVQVLAIFC
jgi:hypothetical protein